MLTFQNINERYFSIQKEKHGQNMIAYDDIVVIDSNIPAEEMKQIVEYVVQNYGCMVFC
jgi:hypothetical protein